MNENPAKKKFCYFTVQGYFLQDEPATEDGKAFDYVGICFARNSLLLTANEKSRNRFNFGLMVREDFRLRAIFWTQWQRFENEVRILNKKSAYNIKYKVIYVARHEEGFHNVAETTYGRRN